jgi:class 3 adenylate cyclase
MSETRKLAAILCSDVVGYSRLAGVDEDRILARLRALRSDLIDPTIAVHNGRIVKRTGDGAIIEFRSVVDAVRCAIEVQNAMVERTAGVPEDRRIVFRVGIHLGDVVEESDGDLMGDGVNIAARLESISKPGAICLSEQAYWQVKGRLDLVVTDLGPTQLKNIAEPIRVYSLEVGAPAHAKSTRAPAPENSAPPRLSMVVLQFVNIGGHPEQEHFVDGVTESLTTDLSRPSLFVVCVVRGAQGEPGCTTTVPGPEAAFPITPPATPPTTAPTGPPTTAPATAPPTTPVTAPSPSASANRGAEMRAMAATAQRHRIGIYAHGAACARCAARRARGRRGGRGALAPPRCPVVGLAV